MSTPIPVPAELGGATALVAQGATMIRVENETLTAAAMQRPRDEAKAIEGALRELDLVPEEAHVAYYSIPYRDTDERNQRGGKARMTYVEGPSVHAARALMR